MATDTSFFFSTGGGDVSHSGKFFISIAVQLAYNIPSLRKYIYNAITKREEGCEPIPLRPVVLAYPPSPVVLG
jgi:hypothetical protein